MKARKAYRGVVAVAGLLALAAALAGSAPGRAAHGGAAPAGRGEAGRPDPGLSARTEATLRERVRESMKNVAPTSWDGVKVVRTDAEWRRLLTPEQYQVSRLAGTERPFTGEYCAFKAEGTYACVGCGLVLFSSEQKFESGTGWPSYWGPVHADRVRYVEDRSHGMARTEILCARCDGHLGHVFPDGPPPTGLRYCLNSASLRFLSEGAGAAPAADGEAAGPAGSPASGPAAGDPPSRR